MGFQAPTEETYPEIEDRLRPLAEPMDRPRPGDWLTEHDERGQTFRQYVSANPVRRTAELHTIRVCRIGHFDEPQNGILDRAIEYLGLFFDVPVRVHRQIPVSAIPQWAKRTHPQWGDRQLLTTHILYNVLEPDRPNDALAYLALCSRDLWPGDGWNFVFGEADLRRRIGVWSIYRNGYPGQSRQAERLCLRRTLMTAAHEIGHVLTMAHCTAFRCLMNGVNHQAEQDSRPFHLCPVCLRKLLWNLQVEPIPYLRRLNAFCRNVGLDEAWYARALALLEG